MSHNNLSAKRTTQNNRGQNQHNQSNIHRSLQQQHLPSSVSSLTILNNMEKVNMVPGFILKLWRMINDPQCDDLISWSDNGQSFIIMDPSRFSQELSKYFKHNNLSSFIRQLNMYGFRKVATIENSGLHPGTEDLHFYHPDFLRDKPDRLESIKRKLPQKLAESVDLRNVYKGISEIEDKQKDVSKTLQDIRRENEMLWAELHDLRQKHQQQQLYISRLMKLVFEAMEQNGIKTNMLQIKRNPPLMIEAATGLAATDTSPLATTAAPSPTTEVFNSTTTTPTSLNQAGIDASVTTSSSPTSVDGAMTNIGPAIMATTLAGDDERSLKKSRLAPPLDDCGTEVYQEHQHQDSTFQLAQTIDLNTPLDAANFDEANQFQMLPNDQLQTQIDSAEYQIDTLVPTIGDFDHEDLSLFTD